MADYYYGAAVCENGHCFNAVLGVGAVADEHCIECGAKNITKCLHCDAKVRGLSTTGINAGVGFAQNFRNCCWNCGRPYPWREKQLSEIERLLALNFDVEDWDEATKERLNEISGAVIAGAASPELVIATGRWLERMGGHAAKALLWEMVKIAGAETLIAGVRQAFGH